MAASAQQVAGFRCCLVEVEVTVAGADQPLLDELHAVLGAAPGQARDRLSVSLRDEGQWLEVSGSGGADASGDSEDLVLGLQSVGFPFRRLEAEPGEIRLAFGEESEPMLVLRGSGCRVRKRAEWRRAVAILLFHRVLRTRRDAIFFHAATLGVGDRGLMLVGPKGAGKSTTALALGARGHSLLGDETAGYAPASGELLPVLRPVGIKPGVRATAISRALDGLGLSPERDGILRLQAERLLSQEPPEPVPLAAVFFLSGFEAAPRLEAVAPSREEVGKLQPIVGSLVNASPLQRVFEMSRMLARARTYRLWPGTPEATAEAVERVMES